MVVDLYVSWDASLNGECRKLWIFSKCSFCGSHKYSVCLGYSAFYALQCSFMWVSIPVFLMCMYHCGWGELFQLVLLIGFISHWQPIELIFSNQFLHRVTNVQDLVFAQCHIVEIPVRWTGRSSGCYCRDFLWLSASFVVQNVSWSTVSVG